MGTMWRTQVFGGKQTTVAEAAASGSGRARRRTSTTVLAAAVLVLGSAVPVAATTGSVPARPTGLSAVAVAHDSVQLSWNDPGDAAITGYLVLRRDRTAGSSGGFSVIADDTGSASTTYVDGSVAANGSYGYRVRALNGEGSSRRSRGARVQTPAAPEPQVEAVVSEPANGAGATTPSDDYPANTTTSGSVAAGGSTTGELDSAGDEDWFSVSLAAGKTYQIDLKGSSSGSGTLPDPYLRGVHDAHGNLIADTGNDDGGHLFDSRVRFTPTSAGAYFVSAGSFWESTTGTYELSVADVTGQPPPAGPADDYAAGTATSGTVKLGEAAFGSLEDFGDRDWFAVELVAGKTYQFDAMGLSTGDGTLADPYLRGIRDSSGQRIRRTSDDDSGTGMNGRVTFTASDSGTHYVVAGTFWDYMTGTYKLSVTDVSAEPDVVEVTDVDPA